MHMTNCKLNQHNSVFITASDNNNGATFQQLLEITDLLRAYEEFRLLFDEANYYFKQDKYQNAFNIIYKIWMSPKIVPALLLYQCFINKGVILPKWNNNAKLYIYSLNKLSGGTRPIIVPHKGVRICMAAVNTILQASCNSWSYGTTGFRPNCGTSLTVNILADGINATLQQNGKCVVVFFDLKNAFNSVNVKHLFETLHLKNLPCSMKNHIYNWQNLIVKNNTEHLNVKGASPARFLQDLTSHRKTVQGLAQGFPYSPTLFAWYLDKLIVKTSPFIVYADNFAGVFNNMVEARNAYEKMSSSLIGHNLVINPHSVSYKSLNYASVSDLHWLGHKITMPNCFVNLRPTVNNIQPSAPNYISVDQWLQMLNKSNWLQLTLTSNWRNF